METKMIDIKKEDTPLNKLLAFVSAGMEVVLTEGKVPVARIVPVSHGAGERIPGLHLGKVWISSDFDTPLPDSFWLGEGAA